MPNPDAMELPRATYRSPGCSVEPIEVVVVVDATEVVDADGPSARDDEPLEQPTAANINELATIKRPVREMAFVTATVHSSWRAVRGHCEPSPLERICASRAGQHERAAGRTPFSMKVTLT